MKLIVALTIIVLVLGCGEVTQRKQSSALQKTSSDNNMLQAYVPELIDSIIYSKFNLDSLRYKRNEIFARHGYIFNSEDLTEHFLKFDWYKPRFKDVTNLMNEVDKQNIQTILNIEAYIKEDNKKRLEYFKTLPDLLTINKDTRFGSSFKEYDFDDEVFLEQFDGYCMTEYGKQINDYCIFVLVSVVFCPVPSLSFDDYHLYIYDLTGNFIASGPTLFSISNSDHVEYYFKYDKMYIKEKQYKNSDKIDDCSGAYISEYTGTIKKVFQMDAKNKTVIQIK